MVGRCHPEPEALECALANLRAGGMAGAVRLERWDIGEIPLTDGVVTALTADLPFGHLLGSHGENERLYPRALAEAARVAAPGARMAVITSEARLIERVLEEQADRWIQERTIRVLPENRHLRIYVLVRSPGGG